ncbi:hypothetical protein V1508DRAFT_399857 [Lipomyces doorenjongii]|uniref:uncharacterized protein n=1 Tax=Lipomyces doorenjongii TaxID=383834 RepID=UPI0034CE962F
MQIKISGLQILPNTRTGMVADCASLGGIGFSFNPEWNVLTCNYCRHIVDKSMLKQHLTMVHKLTIQDEGAMWQTIRSHRIRAHLVVVWDERTERELDDYEHAGRTGYQPPFHSAPSSSSPYLKGTSHLGLVYRRSIESPRTC